MHLDRAFSISSDDLGSISRDVTAENSTWMSESGVADWRIHIPDLGKEKDNQLTVYQYQSDTDIIEKVIDDRTPWIIGHASVEDLQSRKWAWPSIHSVDPSHRLSEIWCFPHVSIWNHIPSKEIQTQLCSENVMYYQTALPVASLRQHSASFLQHQEFQRPRCRMPDFHTHSCHRHWEKP